MTPSIFNPRNQTLQLNPENLNKKRETEVFINNWRLLESIPEGSKIISTEEQNFYNFYQNIISTGGFFYFNQVNCISKWGAYLSFYKEQNSTGGFFYSLEGCSVCTIKV